MEDTQLTTPLTPPTPDTVSSAPQPDPLTGLLQQDFLLQEVARLLRQHKTQPLVASLALFQLENFYEIQRWVGKPEANLLLSDIARLLSKSLPESVLLCRCQHYEFAALLFNEASVNARLLTDRVKQALQSAASDSIPPQLELKCGVGLAPITRNIPCAEVMFARARHDLSQSLYRQRSSELLDGATAPAITLSLSHLMALLRKQQLTLCFQSVASFQDDGLRCYEVRCELPQSESRVPISSLLETAVQNALGENIDRWVIEKTLELLSRQGNEDLRITVNLTQNTLVSPAFYSWLKHQIEHHDTVTERLVFQISELDILTAQHHISSFSRRMNELRVRLCISHFGCTPDPFRYLILVRAQLVKLDATLLEKIDIDRDRQLQLSSIIERLHANGLRVIAPMLEDLRILPLLWEIRVNYIQGFCLHLPSPELNFAFLQERTVDLTPRN